MWFMNGAGALYKESPSCCLLQIYNSYRMGEPGAAEGSLLKGPKEPGGDDCHQDQTIQELQNTSELQEILHELNNEMPEEYFQCANRLVYDCIRKQPSDSKDLLQIFKYIKDPQKKSDKEDSSSSTSWFSATVKVHVIRTGQTFGADKVILDQVKSSSLTVETTKDGQEYDIIVVFCPIKSRVGSDVEAAMKDVPDGKPVVLVLMHHTREVDYSTDVKRWSEDFQNIVLDVHVLFHESQQGLLTCPRNDEAVQKIHEELKKHSRSGYLCWFGY